MVDLELGAIRFATQFTVVTAAALVTTVLLWSSFTALASPTAAQWFVIGLAVALCLTAIVTRRTPVSTWFGVACLLTDVTAVILGPAHDMQHAQASNWIFGLCYIGVVLLTRRVAVLWGAAMLALWMYVVPPATLPVLVGSTTINARWFSAAQLVVSGVWLWKVWYPEVERARRRDLAALRAELNLLESERRRERVAAWRQMLVRTHETVLNDIRYLLDAPSIDRDRLARQVEERERQLQPTLIHTHTVGEVVEEIAVRESLVGVLSWTGPDVTLTDGQSAVLRPAILEAVRNDRRHSRSPAIRVSAVRGPADVTVSVRPDRAPTADPSSPGIGTSIVLEESLRSVGGAVHPQEFGLDLVVPDHTSMPVTDPLLSFDVGRATLTAITAGNAAGGAAFNVLLVIVGAPHEVLLGVLGLAVALLGAAASVRRGRVPVVIPFAVAVMATIVPLLVATNASTCGTLDLGITVAVLTGFGLVATVIWTPSIRWWWIASGWGAGMVLVALRIPHSCTGNAGAALTAAIAPIALFVSIYWSLRTASRRAATLQRLLRDDARVSAAAGAAVDMSAQLHDSVTEASAVMSRIAAGDALDEVTRLRLLCLDSDIRSAIQVDPVTAGGLARAARTLSAAASAGGRPARVLAIRDSGNPRPLDPEVLAAATSLVLAADDGSTVIQVVANPGTEVLMISTSADAARASDLERHWSRSFADGSAELDLDDDMAVLIVQRAVEPVTMATEE